MLDYEKRCPMPSDREPAVKPGDITITAQRMLSDFPELEPEVLSSDPWVIAFNNFVQPDEIQALSQHGDGGDHTQPGRFVRSTASGGRSEDDEFIPLTSEIRTSWTTWCDNST